MAALILRVVNSADLVGRAIDIVTDSIYDHAEIGTPEGTWIGAHDSGC